MLTFLINPSAGSGRAERIWNTLLRSLKKDSISFSAHITHTPDDAARITNTVTDGTLVIIGGDGTINAVITSLTHPERIVLGIIPVGSGNDAARGLKLEMDPSKALDHILNPTDIRAVDVGEVSSGGVKRRFLISSGMGFDASICQKVSASSMKRLFNKWRIGKLIYAGIAVREILFSQPKCITLSLDDGSRHVFERTWVFAFMNLPAEGGGFHFAPSATPQDGTLDLAVVHSMSRFRLLSLLPAARKGTYLKAAGTDLFHCKRACITAPGPLPVHTDGEDAGSHSKVLIGIHPAFVRIIFS